MVRAKFNGEDVMQLTGLTGKELAECINRFRNHVILSYGPYDFFIMVHNKEYIINSFKDFYYEVYQNESD